MYYLGIDMGSTSTKVIVLNENKEIHYKKVVPTGWNCLDTANGILEELKNNEIERDDFKCVATGYGRISVPYMDKTITEISCHGKGACYLFNEKNFTVIDIGGQDTKVIEIENGAVKNFNMNDKCSAGTGKFLEIMANTLGVDINSLCELARSSKNHISISSMCTVFAESEVVSLIGRGTSKEDIAYGVVDSITNKVRGQMGKITGTNNVVRLTGGLCEIPFILDSLSEKLGTEVKSDPLGRYAGALGASLFACNIK
jgi:predicted CoA-substrate-specific enzyme activase